MGSELRKTIEKLLDDYEMYGHWEFRASAGNEVRDALMAALQPAQQGNGPTPELEMLEEAMDIIEGLAENVQKRTLEHYKGNERFLEKLDELIARYAAWKGTPESEVK